MTDKYSSTWEDFVEALGSLTAAQHKRCPFPWHSLSGPHAGQPAAPWLNPMPYPCATSPAQEASSHSSQGTSAALLVFLEDASRSISTFNPILQMRAMKEKGP